MSKLINLTHQRKLSFFEELWNWVTFQRWWKWHERIRAGRSELLHGYPHCNGRNVLAFLTPTDYLQLIPSDYSASTWLYCRCNTCQLDCSMTAFHIIAISPRYLSDGMVRVADVSARRWLRSSATTQLMPAYQLSTIGSPPFPAAAPILFTPGISPEA